MSEENRSETTESHKSARRSFLKRACLSLLALTMPRSLLAMETSQQSLKETIAVLKIVAAGEMLARQRYLAFAQKALTEKHPNIAHLFRALAASEGVHASNFKNILNELGIEVEKIDPSSLQVSSTQQNLKFAGEVELAEIDTQYPDFLKRISKEKHKDAIEKLSYAWQAEKQHRAILEKILSGTGMLFGVLTKEFRSTPMRYFVCQNCGSTLTTLPNESCPICELPVDNYSEINAEK